MDSPAAGRGTGRTTAAETGSPRWQPDDYQALYEAVRTDDLPERAVDLDRDLRRKLRDELRDGWPPGAEARYREMAHIVATESARRWQGLLGRRAAREEMTWRLLRLQAAPYFVLGTSDAATLRVRVGTPWDWRQRFDLAEFEIEPEAAGQPRVGWRIVVADAEADDQRVVEGHVEIRWSHGRFGQPPEAKVYLDTSHHDVPGYFALR